MWPLWPPGPGPASCNLIKEGMRTGEPRAKVPLEDGSASGASAAWGRAWLCRGLRVLASAALGVGEGVCTLHVDLHRQAAEAVHPPEKSHGSLQGHALQDGLRQGLRGLVIHLRAKQECRLLTRVLQLCRGQAYALWEAHSFLDAHRPPSEPSCSALFGTP